MNLFCIALKFTHYNIFFLIWDEKKNENSYVAKDKIWRDNIKQITISARKWPETWGFYLDERLSKISKEQNQTINPISKHLPLRSSGLIGWRSTDETCRLEKYGPYTRGRRTIHKTFNWPDESI